MRSVIRPTFGLIAFLAIGVPQALAHAVLTESSIGKTPIAAQHAATVALTFNSGIETNLTQVVLRGEGPERTLETRAGHKATELLVDIPPLPPGAYALHYKVLAADGHVTEAVLRFKVAAK